MVKPVAGRKNIERLENKNADQFDIMFDQSKTSIVGIVQGHRNDFKSGGT